MPFARLVLTWLLLALLMPLNGILREVGFKRMMGPAPAEWLSAATGIAIILAVTRWLFRIPADTSSVRLGSYALILVALTVAYEFAIGLAGGRAMRELTANYRLWEGRPWPLVLLALAATPFLWRGSRG